MPTDQQSPATPSAPEYVLGTGRDELERLGLQHRLWSDAAHSLWRHAKIRRGDRVLDVGCGPGFAAFDLAQIVGEAGRVVGIDESPNYINYLNAQASSRHLPQLSGLTGDVQNIAHTLARNASTESMGAFDLAYARWVLCFVPSPHAVVAGVANALRPGGRFCVNDYFNYRSMTMAPKRDSHDKAVAATIASWHARGGDTDIMGRLPRLLRDAGFTVDHIGVHQRVARPGDTMFHWPDVWWRIYSPKLVEMGYLSRDDQQQLLRDLDEMTRSDTDFILVPPVFEIVATKQ